eukprot:5677123-Pyramimonas_sp.AAC.1
MPPALPRSLGLDPTSSKVSAARFQDWALACIAQARGASGECPPEGMHHAWLSPQAAPRGLYLH